MRDCFEKLHVNTAAYDRHFDNGVGIRPTLADRDNTRCSGFNIYGQHVE